MSDLKDHIESFELIKDTLSGVLKSDAAPGDRLKAIYHLYQILLEKITDKAPIGFTSLFARLVYILNRLNINRKDIKLHHHFRRSMPNDDEAVTEELIALGHYLILSLLSLLEPKLATPDIVTPHINLVDSGPRKKFIRSLPGVVVEPPDEQGYVSFISEAEGEEKIKAKVLIPKFEQQAKIVFQHISLPVPVNLIDCEVQDDGSVMAKAYVLNPDFLVSVTAIAECFQSEGAYSTAYLVKKLTPTEPTVHMLIGNVVNYLLDEIIHQPELSFPDIAPSLFALSPEQFSLMSDIDLKTCIDKVKVHFTNLKRVVNHDLATIGIDKEHTYLEPSFYAPQYGIYGRLDLYHYDHEKDQSNIVELKSGKLFKPNSYGLNENHYIQTLLYDLMIESVLESQTKSNNYILYSALPSEGLKYAPKVRAKQYEALFVRNDILMIEHMLCHTDDHKYNFLIDKIDPEKIPKGFTFTQRDAKRFHQAYSKLKDYEVSYFQAFVAFVSREYYLSKVGEQGLYSTNGMASLWLNSIEEKNDQFSIFTDLKIIENNSDHVTPTVSLAFADNSNRISKFRVGDIVVLYPAVNNSRHIIKHQIFKSTILELNNEKVVLRLRARQKNPEVFEANKMWHIEGDSLDSGFNQQFGGLFEFINSTQEYRDIWLGIEPPGQPLSIES
ncbi:MAG: hypothetical protein HKN09_11885, partial [Saprospiraceae bacterium]|nr:hypothetical protein [Saprospiraceae bacterium]